MWVLAPLVPEPEGTSKVQPTSTRPKITVTPNGAGVVSHVGSQLLADLAGRKGGEVDETEDDRVDRNGVAGPLERDLAPPASPPWAAEPLGGSDLKSTPPTSLPPSIFPPRRFRPAGTAMSLNRVAAQRSMVRRETSC